MSSLNNPTLLDNIILARISDDSSKEITTRYSMLNRPITMAQLRYGISGQTLKKVACVLPKAVVIESIGSDKRNFATLCRRKHLTFMQSDRINDLSETYLAIKQFFDYDKQDTKEWLETALPALQGEKPISLLSTILGRKVLRDCLIQMRYGNY